MKLSISNIAWPAEQDQDIYHLMKKYGFSGLEIAPTRIFPEHPYECIQEAGSWKDSIRKDYGFEISSMQSIWYGRTEKIFGSEDERTVLADYTKKAVDFAAAIGCPNLVFGCPKNRNIPETGNIETAAGFFNEIGEYAYSRGCVIALEANPPIYGTNFINTTKEALDLIKAVGSYGFQLNLDTGTMIENAENVSQLSGFEGLIHHVHISEPGLRPLVKRKLYEELAEMLAGIDYSGYVSIEAGKQDNPDNISEMMEYVVRVFNDSFN